MGTCSILRKPCYTIYQFEKEVFMEIKVESKKAEISRAENNRLKQILPGQDRKKIDNNGRGRYSPCWFTKMPERNDQTKEKGLNIFDVRDR